MSYAEKLIGNIDPEQENLQLQIDQSHLSNLEKLASDYGWVGNGVKIILEKPTINRVLQEMNVNGLLIGEDKIIGLDKLEEPERDVLYHLLKRQYERSLPIFNAAKKANLSSMTTFL